MKIYLELEGKLGPKAKPQTNQFRPPFPNANFQVRKEPKMTEKIKRLIPTKKYKVKVVARPNLGNATMQLPQECAPVNPESQQPPISENNPHPWKMPLFVQVLHGPELDRCLTISLKKGRIVQYPLPPTPLPT